MKKFFLITQLLVLAFSGVGAQEPATEGVLYTNSKSFGILFHTSGWGLQYRRMSSKNGFVRRIKGIEMVNQRNLKEVKVKNSNFTNSKGYVFGKQYNLWIIRPEFGWERTVYGKEIKSALEISRVFTFGPSVMLAKPVYLEIFNNAKGLDANNITTERFDAEKHTIYNIYGKAPFAAGLEKLSVLPGLYTRLGARFDYAGQENGLKSLELGLVADYQPFGIQQMAFRNKQYLFVNFYLTFSLGSKWY